MPPVRTANARQPKPAIIALAAFCMSAPPVLAQPLPDQRPTGATAIVQELEEIRQSSATDGTLVTDLGRQSEDLAGDLNHLRDELMATSAKVQPLEAGIASLETQIDQLDAQTRQREAELEQRMASMAGTLAALQRMALRPPASLLVSPSNANDIVRTGLLMRSAVPLIEAEAASLRTEMDEIAALHSDLRDRRQRSSTARAELAREIERLAVLARDKEALLSGLTAQQGEVQARIAEQASRATDLETLLAELRRQAAALAANRSADLAAGPADARIFELLRPASSAEGEMAAPTQGRIVHRFGDQKEYGGTHRGTTFAVPPGGRIIAPWDGKVVFAGPFQNFGLILIIDHGEGYHSLLAGFADVSAVVGQWVLTGEPIGSAPGSNETGRDNSEPTLYVELREQGAPVNPLPWLAAHG